MSRRAYPAFALLIAAALLGAPAAPVASQEAELHDQGLKRESVQQGSQRAEVVVVDAEPAPDGRPMRAGSLIVKFRPGAASSARAAAHQSVRALSVEAIGPREMSRVQVRRADVRAALAAYAARPDVEFVQPDYLVEAIDLPRRSAERAAESAAAPNDPRLGELWGLAKIRAQEAWSVTAGSTGVKVAVLDCGVRATHPDLNGKVVGAQNFTTAGTVDDLCNHGTHVAGTVAAAGDNGIGVAGVAHGAVLMNGKVLGDNGRGSTSWVIAGIKWAADHGAKVINLSLGGRGECSRAEQEAVDYARQKNVVVVAAAGNDSKDDVIRPASTPANCANVLAVAATTSADQRASFSNAGLNVDVAAPGSGILSTVNPSVNGGSEYRWFNGTSMATPHVAGLAALLWSTPYGTSVDSVVSRITETADAIAGTGSLWKHGRVNALAAVSYPSISIADVGVAEGNAGAVGLTFTVSLSATSNRTVEVSYGTVDDSASAGSDFEAVSGRLTFAPGQLTQTIAVPVRGDGEGEGDQRFFVDLSNPTNAGIARARAIGTIVDDDTLVGGGPSLSIADVGRAEGQDGTTDFTFTVSLSAVSSQPVEVSYATANDSALAGSDFDATSGRLSFSPGQLSQQVMVRVRGDGAVESDERFFVDLSAPTNAGIERGRAVGTIQNDDAAVSCAPPRPLIRLAGQRPDGSIKLAGKPRVAGPCSLVAQRLRFGDGKRTSKNPVWHAYKQPGDYRVSYRVADSNGQVAERCIRVRISSEQQPKILGRCGTR